MTYPQGIIMEEIKEVEQQVIALTGDRLTGHKAAHICARDGYTVTGVVLTKAAKEGDNFTGVRRCIVNLSAVRWFDDQDKWAEMMYPDNPPAHPHPKAATEPDKMHAFRHPLESDELFERQREYCKGWNACIDAMTAAPSLPAKSDKSKWALKQIADLDPKTGSIGTAVFMAREALAQSEREHND